MFGKVKIGDEVRLPSGATGIVKREAWGGRLVIERIGNISGKPIEVVLDKNEVKKG